MGDDFEHKEVFNFMMESVVNNVERHTVTLAENHRSLGLDAIDEEDREFSSSSSDDDDDGDSDSSSQNNQGTPKKLTEAQDMQKNLALNLLKKV